MQAQPPPGPLVHGRDYLFQRAYVERQVADEHDRGTIRLACYVWRPIGSIRPTGVVIYSHGATGGDASEREPTNLPPRPFIGTMLRRGWTVISPMRRGVGESSGTYIEECSLRGDPACDRDRFFALGVRGLDEALADTLAVADGVAPQFAPADASPRLLMIGHSRGGILSLAFAAAHRERVRGVVNFSGGWFGNFAELTAEETARRRAFVEGRLAQDGAAFAGPTLWIYGVRDSRRDEAALLALPAAYVGGGGRAEWHYIREHNLPDGHHVITQPPLWQARLDAFLATLEA
jgi:pimeloyl-ACP methyl ester carboxylesterase